MTEMIIICVLLILLGPIHEVIEIWRKSIERKNKRLEEIDRLNQSIYSPTEYEKRYGDDQ